MRSGARATRRTVAEGVLQNAGYMAAAYIVTALLLIGYALSLYRRSRGL